MKSTKITNKIKFFISSTFKEMQHEREVLRKFVMPELEEYGRKKGIFVDFCDLRWGIAEEKDLGKIMQVCLYEARECRPYLITMIGEQYGTLDNNPIGLREEIKSTWSLLDYVDGINDKSGNARHFGLPNPMSLTQWELEYALLTRESNETCAICCRKKVETKGKDEKSIKELKDKINKKGKSEKKVFVFDYPDLGDSVKESYFCKTIIRRGKMIIDDCVKELGQKNRYDIEKINSELYCEQKTQYFAGRRKQAKAIKDLITKNSVVQLYGRSGIGKSSLMARLYLDLPEGQQGLFVACGVGENSKQYVDVLRQLVYALNQAYNLTSDNERVDDRLVKTKINIDEKLVDEGRTEDKLIELIKIYEKSKNPEIRFFVDAIDKLESEGAIKIFERIADLSTKKVSFVISAIDKLPMQGGFQYKIDKLSKDDKRAIIKEELFLKSNWHSESEALPEYSEELCDAIITKAGSDSPLYINAVINILKMGLVDIGKGITDKSRMKQMAETVKGLADSTEQICWQALEKAGQDLKIDNYREIISLMAVSNRGLREIDLAGIISEDKWKSVDFACYRRFLGMFFREQDGGYWTFEHDIIKTSVINHLKNDSTYDVTHYQAKLCNYVLCNGNNKHENEKRREVRTREGWRLCGELFASKKDEEKREELESRLISDIILLDSSNSFKWTDDINQRTRSAQELQDVLDDKKYDLWFFNFFMRDEKVFLLFLSALIENRNYDDVPRRLPAKQITELYFRFRRLNKRHDFEYWASQAGDNEKEFWMANLCSEYVEVCDVVDEAYSSMEQSLFATEYYLDHRNVKKMNRRQRTMAFKNLNAILYTNCIVKNNLSNRTDRVITKESALLNDQLLKIVDNYEAVKDSFSKQEKLKSLYESNVGQYYNGQKMYEDALEYHTNSLLMKIQLLNEELKESVKKGNLKNGELSISVDSIKLGPLKTILEKTNLRKLKKELLVVQKEIEEMDSLGKDYLSLIDQWNRVAIGFRNVGSDMFHLSRILKNSSEKNLKHRLEKMLEFGCTVQDIAVDMADAKFMGSFRKESIITNGNRIGMYLLKDRLEVCEIENLIEKSISTITTYNREALLYGPREGGKIRDNIGSLLTRAKKEMRNLTPKNKNQIAKAIKQLEESHRALSNKIEQVTG